VTLPQSHCRHRRSRSSRSRKFVGLWWRSPAPFSAEASVAKTTFLPSTSTLAPSKWHSHVPKWSPSTQSDLLSSSSRLSISSRLDCSVACARNTFRLFVRQVLVSSRLSVDESSNCRGTNMGRWRLLENLRTLQCNGLV
jgi:hypothetical protein